LITPDHPDPPVTSNDNYNIHADKNLPPRSDIRPENIPEELKAITHWIVWDYGNKDGEIIKVPVDPKTGTWINAHDSKNWLTFEEALKLSKKLKLGLGFDLTKDLGYVFVDLDHVYKNGIIEDPRFKAIVENADTFIEISPSGEGFHLFFKCPGFNFDSTRPNGVEIYTKDRYSTFTGIPYGELKPIREIEPDDLKLLLGLKEERELDKESEVRNKTLDDIQKKEITELLEQNWDLNKTESEGNHHNVGETTAVYFKDAGISEKEAKDFLLPFNRSHPLKDGKVHPEKDLINIIHYVYTHDYKKTAPAGSVSKEFKRELYRILHKNEKTQDHTQDLLYVPGPARIVEALKEKYILKTIPELGTDKEQIFYFDGAIYKRAEEFIKEQAHREYLRQFKEVLEIAEQERNKEYTMKMKRALDKGPSMNDINEVLGIIRRTTFSFDEINPDGHIPFKNGLLNLSTGELEPFNPEMFYTYQIDANLLKSYITLNDVPLFKYLLNSLLDPEYIPTVLSYLAYCLYPRLPSHKVLFITGRERIGKGTLTRVIKGLMPHGSASISLARILTADRFKFQGVEGKNLLIDMETRRKFKRGTVLDWTAFANLFGEDVLNVEPKGKESHDYISRAKGIFLGNLPFINIDDPPAVSRILLAETKSKRPKKVFKELHEIILERERDKIATLLIQILFKLRESNFEFPLPGFIIRKHKQEIRTMVELYEKTVPVDLRSPEHELFPFKKETRLEVDNEKIDDLTGEILDKLADPVENFIGEMVEEDPDARISYDEAYEAFQDYCSRKGITVLKRQTFLKNFGYHFERRRLGPRGNQTYYFTGCKIEPYEKDGEQEETEILDQKTLIEIFPELKGSIQVGYALNDKNPLKNSGSQNNSNGIQLASSINRVRNKKENENKEYNNKKDTAHKFDTGENNQKPSENKAPEDNKPVSNLNKDNEAPHFKTTYQRYHDWDYFRVMDTFDSYLFGKKKRHPKGNVIKFPIVEAPKYIEKGFLAPACPLGYAWDESEKTCVEIQEGDKNGNDK